MSGMLGAIAIASVRASRQAEGCGGVAAFGSASWSSGDVDGSIVAEGACTGRGLGKGTLAVATPLASAKRVWPQQTSSSAAALTMATLRTPLPPEAHLRRARPALDFASKNAKKAIEHSGGTSLCWD